MKRLATVVAVLAVLALGASARAVIINEFLYTTDGGNAYIEILNRTGSPYLNELGAPVTARSINISGWQVQQGNADPGASSVWSPIVTVDAGTTLTAGQFYLVATQDVFVAVPDQESSFSILPGDTTYVRGLRIVNPPEVGASRVKDTVLYAKAGATNASTLVDDTTYFIGPNILRTDTVTYPMTGGTSGTVNIDTHLGAGVRRGNALTDSPDMSEGNARDTNNAKKDFIGFTEGGGSPKSQTTPVTLSVFEAR